MDVTGHVTPWIDKTVDLTWCCEWSDMVLLLLMVDPSFGGAFRRSALYFGYFVCGCPLIAVPEIRRMETFPMERFDCQVAMASKIAVKRKPTASKHTLYTVVSSQVSSPHMLRRGLNWSVANFYPPSISWAIPIAWNMQSAFMKPVTAVLHTPTPTNLVPDTSSSEMGKGNYPLKTGHVVAQPRKLRRLADIAAKIAALLSKREQWLLMNVARISAL